MNIGIVCYPTYGGSGVVATELGIGLAKRGHKVHFLSYARPQRLNEFEHNIDFHEVAVNVYPLFEYPPYDLALASHMVNLIKYQKLDVLHVHYAIPHATSAFLAKKILGEEGRRVAVLTTLHGTDITIVGSDPSYLPVVEFSINQSDSVTAVSDYLKEETYEKFGITRNIHVIPNFVDLDRFKRVERSHFKKAICPDSEFVITHVSNFRKVKRVADAVEVFSRVLQSGIKAKLLLVGDGPDRVNVEARCRELGVCDQVRMLGKQEKIEEILSISDLFLMPSGSETFGLAALEAMSCSVPVISSDVGGLPGLNLHGKTGYVRHLGDVDGMAQAAIEMLNNAELHQELSHNARKRAEQFELNTIVAEYESHYERVLQKVRQTSLA
ncbi:N-acetyl-alpha-D-glucosaminyl L-malate synthase BshA [Cyclonatronum proteinivorum]|uniref:N-acetyl-alpha-D-glucosaminyl L-malate synthase BshA n=1 Tax=Cyclonatronum proteinivorum TaxID=1457365 RepID=A0A345UPR0_9BACT|nr:N-acetyl-alpha-D-glucosaminyl L-malate synthase BshA [Cyclonatronum proteinivorum]AXJ02462.1 N-acetyl-alpha-D-glucosaminyl L-malate synthase BshA [Cyclonatronum proteinivorum]